MFHVYEDKSTGHAVHKVSCISLSNAKAKAKKLKKETGQDHYVVEISHRYSTDPEWFGFKLDHDKHKTT